MIIINKKFINSLGYDDYRDFAEALGQWAYTNDFTYRDSLYDPQQGATFQRFLTAFVKSHDND